MGCRDVVLHLQVVWVQGLIDFPLLRGPGIYIATYTPCRFESPISDRGM